MAWTSGVVLACYWFAPSEVWMAALAPWRDLAPALTVYLTAAVLAADMLWLRRQICLHVCPYGPLLGTVADQNTLAVRYLGRARRRVHRVSSVRSRLPDGY